MDFRKLKAFLVLAETLSYHKAASELYITQPALTRQINSLENLLGGLLFLRGPGGTVLTEFGKNLYLEARMLIDHVDKFKLLAEMSAKKNINYFKIATTFSAKKYINFIKKLPIGDSGVYFYLTNGMTSDDLKHQLNHGKIQLAIMSDPFADNLGYKKLSTEKIAIIVRRDFHSHINKKIWIDQIISVNKINTIMDIYTAYQYGNFSPVFRTNDINALAEIIVSANLFSLVPYYIIDDITSNYADDMDIYDTGLTMNLSIVWSENYLNETTRRMIDIFCGESFSQNNGSLVTSNIAG